jgi:excisionase family DNA binding protein
VTNHPTQARRQYLSVHEVADKFAVHPQSVYRLVAEGRLPAIRVGRSIRIDADRVQAQLDQNKQL